MRMLVGGCFFDWIPRTSLEIVQDSEQSMLLGATLHDVHRLGLHLRLGEASVRILPE